MWQDPAVHKPRPDCGMYHHHQHHYFPHRPRGITPVSRIRGATTIFTLPSIMRSKGHYLHSWANISQIP
ncbi:UNVERIFIED_CONTAM: hypothetical protein Sangu_3005000 [Sesamum angustifolium]|uniref:Uncharacterized protein n=1 Tax=Sesamum angustifolium TaxID=2727405 RepID=A0AAW2KMY9_9LAMI